MKSKTISIRIITEASMIVALATVLSYIKILHLPQGGSITAGSMVPLLWFSLRRGSKIGVFACLIYGLVQLMLEPYVYHPVQVLLDYPLAFGVIGLAGLFKRRPIIGVVVGIAGRFVAHFLSGIIFFAEYAPPGIHPAIYSAIYNGSYLMGEIVVSAILTHLIIKRGLLEIYL